MGAIRPKRIVRGAANHFLGRNKETGESRMKVCSGCEHKIKLGPSEHCGICYCKLTWKTKEMSEYCPDDRWADIKRIPTADPNDNSYSGMILRVKGDNMDKVHMSVTKNSVVVEFIEPVLVGTAEEDVKLNFEVINDRKSLDDLPVEEQPVTISNLYICPSCFFIPQKISQQSPVRLLDDELFEFSATFNTQITSPKLEKTLIITTDKGPLRVDFKVKTTNQP
jgi:hypothetical protein